VIYGHRNDGNRYPAKSRPKKNANIYYKRVSTRYEKLAITFLNFVLVAAVFDWLKSF